MGSVGAAAVGLGLALLVTSCGGSSPAPDTDAGPAPSLTAEIVQLRRDEVLERVEVGLRNTGRVGVVVEQLTLRVPGFRSPGPVPKDSPIPPGGLVNLPTPYGGVRCAHDGRPRVGRPVVTLRLHTTARPESRRLVLTPRDPDGLLARIAERECTQRRLSREIRLGFGEQWRQERTPDGVVLHGTLDASLLADSPRDVTQVAGTVIYALAADGGPGEGPLARLTPTRREASVPVTVSVSRCDGHARGETKKPYEFLVWVAPPGGPEVAVTPVVDESDRAALQAVCPL
jgi:hypothetical protein